MRNEFFASVVIMAIALGLLLAWAPHLWWLVIPLGAIILIGLRDVIQTRHSILRNFPVIGHGRYLLEAIRPEITQYFVEQNHDGRPINREERSVVYQRAKRNLDTLPFGTQKDVYAEGYEWIDHSMIPGHPEGDAPRIRIGGEKCTQPYEASVLNISAMSYGSLSRNAILALNGGAKRGGFYHNTGEGGVSPYHLELGGDLVWQIGTGYFGCRTRDGGFDPERFARTAEASSVRMIELKLSQGAKPGHGGILPARKVTEEISHIRGVPMGVDVLSPPGHQTFKTPIQLVQWVEEVRELSGGLPVGIKFCVGHPHQVMAICLAMLETGLLPDYIAVDGGEGGTGAAPLEFSNSVGTPLTEGLVLVHNALVGFGLRQHVRVIASGKLSTGFHLAQRIAIGADLCASARGMMFAVGCIQALRCNANDCPTGVATQDPELVQGLVVEDKADRVFHYHRETVEALMELIAAAGLQHPDQLRPEHIQRRISPHEVHHYGEVYNYVKTGAFMSGESPPYFSEALRGARADTFDYVT